MKVHESSLNQAAASQLGKAREAEAVTLGGSKKSSEAQPRQESDRVQLSELSGQLLATQSAESPQRATRVEKLAVDYRAGRYQPNSLETSRRIVDDAIGHAP
jgi:anti-sigma28 factor (negative regulator of flagellin synthesis)